jgi:hypothetical protein
MALRLAGVAQRNRDLSKEPKLSLLASVHRNLENRGLPACQDGRRCLEECVRSHLNSPRGSGTGSRSPAVEHTSPPLGTPGSSERTLVMSSASNLLTHASLRRYLCIIYVCTYSI